MKYCDYCACRLVTWWSWDGRFWGWYLVASCKVCKLVCVNYFGHHFQVLYQFVTATNSKDRPTVDGKNSAKCRANLLDEQWMFLTPISNVSIPSLRVFPIHNGRVASSIPYRAQWVNSVETNFNFPNRSLQSHLWNLLKSSRHVISRNQGTFSR